MSGCEDCDKCFECGGQCCKSVAVRIDTPESMDEFQDLKWYIYHGFSVFLDDEDDWHVDMPVNCKMLDKDNKCKIYEKRPPVCRIFSAADCDDEDDGGYKLHFTTVEEVDEHIDNLKAQGNL